MKATSIELDEKGGGKRFNVKLPNRTYCLQAEVRGASASPTQSRPLKDEESALEWISDLRLRQSNKPLRDTMDGAWLPCIADPVA